MARAPFGLTIRSQGHFEVELPEGFGIPVLSNETLGVNTQVLDHNIAEPDVDVRFRISVDYVLDSEARGRLKPLYPSMAFVSTDQDAMATFFVYLYDPETERAIETLRRDAAPSGV